MLGMSKRGRGRTHWLRYVFVIGVAILALKACAYSNTATQLQHQMPPGWHVVGAH